MASAEMQPWKLPGSLMKTLHSTCPPERIRPETKTEQAGARTAKGCICKQCSALRAGGEGRMRGMDDAVVQHGPPSEQVECCPAGPGARRAAAGRDWANIRRP